MRTKWYLLIHGDDKKCSSTAFPVSSPLQTPKKDLTELKSPLPPPPQICQKGKKKKKSVLLGLLSVLPTSFPFPGLVLHHLEYRGHVEVAAGKGSRNWWFLRHFDSDGWTSHILTLLPTISQERVRNGFIEQCFLLSWSILRWQSNFQVRRKFLSDGKVTGDKNNGCGRWQKEEWLWCGFYGWGTQDMMEEGARCGSHNEAVQSLACAQPALFYSQITQKCTNISFSRLLTAEII